MAELLLVLECKEGGTTPFLAVTEYEISFPAPAGTRHAGKHKLY